MLLKNIKLSIVLIPLLNLVGCSTLFPFNYTYKTSDRHPILTRSDIQQNPVIGVALLNKKGAHETSHVESGIYKFATHEESNYLTYEIFYKNIGSEIILDDNRNVSNAGSIIKKYPKMRYALVLWKHAPQITQYSFDESRTINSDGNERVVYDRVYKTTLSINSELVLFDLVDNLVLAKSIKNLEDSNTYKKKHMEPGSNALSQVVYAIDVLNEITDDSAKYPTVDAGSVEMKYKNYVYSFLKNINNK